MKSSQVLKVVILLIPTVTFIDTNLIAQITPFSFITSIILLSLLYFLNTTNIGWVNLK